MNLSIESPVNSSGHLVCSSVYCILLYSTFIYESLFVFSTSITIGCSRFILRIDIYTGLFICVEDYRIPNCMIGFGLFDFRYFEKSVENVRDEHWFIFFKKNQNVDSCQIWNRCSGRYLKFSVYEVGTTIEDFSSS